MIYHRRNNNEATPANADADHTMWVDDSGAEQIISYGNYHWTIEIEPGQDLGDGYRAIEAEEAMRLARESEEFVDSLDLLGYDVDGVIAEIDPAHIVDHADYWDNLELVQLYWDCVADHHSIGAIITRDGVIIFGDLAETATCTYSDPYDDDEIAA